ncbi:MAG TPA: hypothetical protein VMU30_02910 [Bacteroidota bacterium]|nr:hypothetical protein [Bacteroidota bacterium]
MNFNNAMKIFGCWLLFIVISILNAGCSSPKIGDDALPIGRAPKLQPDYSEIVIPPNIAPLNFVIKEEGEAYHVQLHSRNGDAIQIQSRNGIINIPTGDWKRLLAENTGEELVVDVAMKNQVGQWIKFNSVINRIARDSIDAYLTFRRFRPIFNLWSKMGIFQRCLENFDEKPVLLNRSTNSNCMNCHNFWQNGTERWLLHLRGGPGTSMLLVTDGKAQKIKTKTKFNGPTAYPAWHPSGNLIAFSVSNLILFYHESGECRDVLDRYSDIVLYDIPTNTISTVPQLSDSNRMEIWPAWSPDGKYLYFCSAPKLSTFKNPNRPDDFLYEKIKYDLMRIAYDPVKRTWGNLETVIASSDIGLSITEPRVSPDGRFVLFTAAQYSQFPIYLSSADLYLLDIAAGRWKKLEMNSDRADSFHSWSSNGKWVVFSSKRQNGVFTQPFFTHIDSSGIASKAFVLPQEDPLSDETSLEVFNVPELTKEPVRISPQDLAKAAFEDALNANLDPHVLAGNNIEKTNPVEHALPSLKNQKRNFKK